MDLKKHYSVIIYTITFHCTNNIQWTLIDSQKINPSNWFQLVRCNTRAIEMVSDKTISVTYGRCARSNAVPFFKHKNIAIAAESFNTIQTDEYLFIHISGNKCWNKCCNLYYALKCPPPITEITYRDHYMPLA